MFLLIAVSKTTHAAHDPQYVVIHGIDLNFGRRRDGGGKVQHRGVNAGHVQGARGLVRLGLQGEGIDIDTGGHGDVLVVLVGLHQVEVGSRAFREAVLAVQLQFRGRQQGRVGNRRGHQVGGGRLEVEPLVGAGGSVALDNPDQFLDGVVEVQFDLVVQASDGFITGELQLLNQVFVAQLGEPAAFVGVQEDVIHPQGRGDVVAGGGGTQTHALGLGAELNVNLDFVVLQGNQRQRQTGVAAEEELQGHIQGLGAGGFGKGGTFTNHLLEASQFAGGQRQFVPDVHPVAVVLVNALATDFQFHVLDQRQADIIHIGVVVSGVGDGHLQIHTVDQITVAADLAGHALAEANGAVKGLLDGFHGEVGVAAIDHLEEGDLGVTGQVHILGAIGNELQKSSGHL